MSSTVTTTTGVATSADGTKIAYETIGSGPALVLVDGALAQLRSARGLATAPGTEVFRPPALGYTR